MPSLHLHRYALSQSEKRRTCRIGSAWISALGVLSARVEISPHDSMMLRLISCASEEFPMD